MCLLTANCYNPTFQAQGGNWTLSNCGIEFSKVLCSVTLYSAYTRALTFENLDRGARCDERRYYRLKEKNKKINLFFLFFMNSGQRCAL
jgi:hypothetical protein